MNIFAGPYLLIKAVILLLSSGALIKKSLIPGLVALMSTVGFFSLLNENMHHLRSWSEGLDKLASMFTYFDGVFSVLITLLLAPFLVMLIALPLCEPLAAEVDRRHGGQEVEVSFWYGVLSGMSLSLKLVILGLSVSIGLTIISFIPVIGFFAGLFNVVIWTPFILSLDITDFVFSRRAKSLSQRFKVLLGSPLNTISIGLVALPLLGTPFLNLVGTPIAVIMGTLYARQLESE
jgi:uncharacterized protein involved in cysteine biosynthesis